MVTNTYKVVLIGDSGVGKTAFVNSHLTGEFTKKYVPALGVEVEVHPAKFNTTEGPVIFNIWDYTGQEKFSRPGECYYADADAAIIVCDLTSEKSSNSSIYWYLKFIKHTMNKPVVFIENTCDSDDEDIISYGEFLEKRTPKDLSNVMYYSISAENLFNFKALFVYLIRKFTGNEKLDLAFPVKISVSNESNTKNNTSVSGFVSDTKETKKKVSSDDFQMDEEDIEKLNNEKFKKEILMELAELTKKIANNL